MADIETGALLAALGAEIEELGEDYLGIVTVTVSRKDGRVFGTVNGGFVLDRAGLTFENVLEDALAIVRPLPEGAMVSDPVSGR